MIIYITVVIALAAVLSGPAWLAARKRNTWFSWDYATIVVPFAFWVILAGGGVGAQSLSNLIELVILLALVPAALSTRVFALDGFSKQPYLNSIGTFAPMHGRCPCFAAVDAANS
jgi:hypothetical protein